MRMLAIAALTMLVAVPARGQGHLYAVDRSDNRFSIDRATAATEPVRSDCYWYGLPGNPRGMAHVPDGVMYVSTGDSLWLVFVPGEFGYPDANFCYPELVGAFAGSRFDMQGIQWHPPSNTLLGTSNGDIYSIDLRTGAATLLGSTGLRSASGLVYDSTNGVMYMTSSSTDCLYTVDLATCTATLIGPLGVSSPSALTYVPEDDAIYLVGAKRHLPDALYIVNRATGAATEIGPTGTNGVQGLAWVGDGWSCDSWCPSDYNHDWSIDGADLGDFLSDFELGTKCADFDRDGGVTTDDLTAFLECFMLCDC